MDEPHAIASFFFGVSAMYVLLFQVFIFIIYAAGRRFILNDNPILQSVRKAIPPKIIGGAAETVDGTYYACSGIMCVFISLFLLLALVIPLGWCAANYSPAVTFDVTTQAGSVAVVGMTFACFAFVAYVVLLACSGPSWRFSVL